MIDFNQAPFVGTELRYIKEAVDRHKICGDGLFTEKCQACLNELLQIPASYLTTSGTAALEMAALLCGIEPGDEVILPSYTFCSTANAFALRGAKLVFVDIRPDTLNLDETKIEDAVTEKTRAIVPVHYAGVSCEMDAILAIAKKHGLFVIEDAAQAIGSTYHGKMCGTIGDFGCLSFHETKNFSMGEGGALLIPDLKDRDRAEIFREKGTDRSQFFRGQVDKYTWRDIGSSYLPSDILAAYLWAQLEVYDQIYEKRMAVWNRYHEAFLPFQKEGRIELPVIPEGCTHNAHLFYIKLRDITERSAFLKHMKERGVLAVFHYVPLHSAPAGQAFGRFHGEDRYTTKESERIARLPLYYALSEEDQETVIAAASEFLSA